MYALVKIGGCQYRLTPNETLKVNRLQGEVGSSFVVSDVMLVEDNGVVEVGHPHLPYAITLELLTQGQGKKNTTYHFTKRGGHRVKHGWRNYFSIVRVKSIVKGA